MLAISLLNCRHRDPLIGFKRTGEAGADSEIGIQNLIFLVICLQNDFAVAIQIEVCHIPDHAHRAGVAVFLLPELLVQ